MRKMKKTASTKKLSFHSSTVRLLSTSDLKQIVGGATASCGGSCGCTAASCDATTCRDA